MSAAFSRVAPPPLPRSADRAEPSVGRKPRTARPGLAGFRLSSLASGRPPVQRPPLRGERCTLPTLVTRGSLIFKEMIIFLTGGLSLVLRGAGPGGGGGVRVRGRDATANRGRRRVGLAAFARPGPWRAPVPFVCLFV